MTLLFFLTAALGLVLSNTATAVLLAPIAVRPAEVLGVSPYPLAMAVAIAASAAFVTPVSAPVVTSRRATTASSTSSRRELRCSSSPGRRGFW